MSIKKKAMPDLNEVWNELENGRFSIHGLKKAKHGKGLVSRWLEDVHGFSSAARKAQAYAKNPDFTSVEIHDKNSNATVAVATKD
jgi:hypothetical protein